MNRTIGTGLLAGAILVAANPPAVEAQEEGALAGLPFEVRHVIQAADSILSSPGGVSLEAFRNDTVTGVYLKGSFDGRDESVGFGRAPEGLRYLWFSIGDEPGVEYVALVYDVDQDLAADFLLLRTIDRNGRTDYAVEYRAPVVRDLVFDISLQPACQPPRCDPATWTERPRRTLVVPAGWFDPWRPLLSLAASRGERWLGQPVALLSPRSSPDSR